MVDSKQFVNEVVMAKKGAALEQLVALIQETLKDRPDATIQTNVKVVDNTGIPREIDVLVYTNVQELPLGIAIECKDYSKKAVDIQVVDEFIGKCKYLNNLHRKIIVSTSGFSGNARKRAKEEDIILCSLEDLLLDIMASDTRIYNPKIKIEFCQETITFSTNVELDSIDCFDCYLTEGESLYDFRKEVFRVLNEFSCKISLVEMFLKKGKKPFLINNKFSFEPNVLYVNNKDGVRIGVDEVVVSVMVDVEMNEGEIVKQQRFVQGKELIITENRFENDCNVVVVDGGDKWGAAFKKDNQYVKPTIQIKC